MNVVIVAGGLGTRFKSLSVIPKLLLPLPGEDSILKHNLKIFEGNDITVIINLKFYGMLENYVKINNLTNVHVIGTDNCNGSYNTIMSCYPSVPKKDVLFVWSDLILERKFQEVDTSKNQVFTYGGAYRYRFSNSKVEHADNYDGNVPGIYFIKDLDKTLTIPLNTYDNFDLIDAIDYKSTFEQFEECELANSLIEFRDLETYTSIMHSSIECKNLTRFFNELRKDDNDPNTLIKTAIDDNYIKIIQREFNWYKTLKKLDLHHKIVPNTANEMENERSFKMQYLDGYCTLNSFRKSTYLEQINVVYRKIFNYLEDLSSNTINVPIEVFKEDLQLELVDKVIDRCNKIKYMLVNYKEEELKEILTKAFNEIWSEYKDEKYIQYGFCHGDLNGSNIMVNPTTLDVKFIDPRGYFGNTKLYGWIPYEYAKLRYSLNGYDDFNTMAQVYTVDEPKVNYFVLSEDAISEKLDNRLMKILVGIIYIALAGYISQDICKANIAYEYGMKLLKNLY